MQCMDIIINFIMSLSVYEGIVLYHARSILTVEHSKRGKVAATTCGPPN